MGLSILKFLYTGDKDFELNFALGYASRSDIACYISGDNPIDVEFDWLTDSAVRIIPTGVTVGDEVVFTRTVSKTELPVDLTADGNLTRENVEAAVKFTMYAQHELLDGRFGDAVDYNDTIFTTVTTSVETALRNFLFQTAVKRDVVLNPSFTESATETYTSGDTFCQASDVLVFVKTPPANDVELNIENAGVVQFSVTINTLGNEVSRSTNQVNFEAGEIASSVTGDDFTTGIEAYFVFPMITSTLADFDPVVTDYVAEFEDARTT